MDPASRAAKSTAHALVRKYTELIRRAEQLGRDRVLTQVMGRWAMQAAGPGFALLNHSGIIVNNSKWNALDRAGYRRGHWRVARAPSSAGVARLEWRTLREAVLEYGALLRKSPDPNWSMRFFVPPDGPYVEVRLEKLLGRDAPYGSLMVMGQDVTDTVALERQLERAKAAVLEREQTRAIAELASSFGHDFNTLLAAARFRLDALSDVADAAVRSHVDALDDILETTATRVRQMQDLARTRRDRPAVELQLQGVVKAAVELAEQQLRRAPYKEHAPRYHVTVRVPAKHKVRADPAELTQALIGLILASAEAMHGGGKITVRSTDARGAVTLFIEDTGGHFDLRDLAALLDPFFPGSALRSNEGIPFASAVVDKCGGSLSVKNRARGVQIALHFPRVDQAPVRARVAVQRVLVIEDNEQLRHSLAVALPEMDLTLTRSGPEAIRSLKRNLKVDAVLCDLDLPDMDGWTIAAKIRELRPKLPIFIMSAWARELDPLDPRRKLVKGVLQKPASREALVAMLRRG